MADGGERQDWSGYGAGPSYTEAGFSAKQEFVESALKEFHPRRVLDVGCNTGHFAALAARQGARVVAIDADAAGGGAGRRRGGGGRGRGGGGGRVARAPAARGQPGAAESRRRLAQPRMRK